MLERFIGEDDDNGDDGSGGGDVEDAGKFLSLLQLPFVPVQEIKIFVFVC